MPFKITCANGHAMMIRDEHAGRHVKCPTCGLGFVATTPGEALPPAPPAPVTPSPPPTARLVMDAVLAGDDEAPRRGRRPMRPEERARATPRNVPHRLPRRNREDDDAPPRASGVAVGWIVAGVIAAVLLVIAGAGVAVYFLVFYEPTLPPTVKRAQQLLTRDFGADRVVVLELHGVTPNSAEAAWAIKRVTELSTSLSSGRTASHSIYDAGVVFLVVGGVKDVSALADNVNFGEVTKVSTRHRYVVIEADLHRIAQLMDPKAPDPPGPFNPVPPANRRRPPAASSPPAASTPPVTPKDDTPVRMTGPIAHWSFDEDEGDVVKDLSGNGLPGKLVGCKRVPGIHGKGIEFAGQGTYFEYGEGPAYNFAADAPFSFAFWFRSSDRNGTLLCQRKRGQEAAMIRLTFDPFGVGAEVCGDQDGAAPLPARVNAVLKVNDDQWHHVTLVRAGNDLELFVDGESRAKTTNPVAGGSITTDLRHLGVEGYHMLHGASVAYPHFKGVMDDFYIFNRELSAEEIRELASK